MRAQHIGYAWPAFDLVIERGSAIAFARGLDETDPALPCSPPIR